MQNRTGGYRKSKPKPYQRPSVDLAVSPVKRAWLEVSADSLAPGDTIAHRGLIHEVDKADLQYVWVRSGVDPAFKMYFPDDEVFAFVPVTQ